MQVIEQLNEKIIFCDDLNDKQKVMINETLGVRHFYTFIISDINNTMKIIMDFFKVCDYRLTEGCDEYLQLLHIFSAISAAYKM